MIELLQTILDLLSSFGTFIESELNSLGALITFAPQALYVIASITTYLPNMITLFIGIIISIKILFLVLGR